MYPDATGTLRLSFGQAKGPVKDNGIGPFVTTIGGAFVRSTGRDPFALPVSWVEAKDKLNLDLPLNVATTNEVVGGNSGSPFGDSHHLACQSLGLREEVFVARASMNARGVRAPVVRQP
jgi:hypothetical protein